MSRPRLATREELRSRQILPRRVLVEVTRDMAEVISKVVFEHEIDVLAEVFGEGAVSVVDDPLKYNILIGPIDVINEARKEADNAAKRRQRVNVLYTHPEHPVRWEPRDIDNPAAGGQWIDDPMYVGDEMARLRTLYGMHHERKEFFVDVAYPHEKDFIDACGGLYEPKKVKDAA